MSYASTRHSFSLEIGIRDLELPYHRDKDQIGVHVSVDSNLVNILSMKTSAKRARAKIDEYDKYLRLKVVLLEQIYRVFTIKRGEPYHR